EQDIDVFLLAKNRANRRRNICRGKSGHCDLIEKRLEEVMIGAINDGDFNRGAFESLGCSQSAKSRTDDDDMRQIGFHCISMSGGLTVRWTLNQDAQYDSNLLGCRLHTDLA